MKVRFFDIDWDISDSCDELAAVDAPELPTEVTLEVKDDADLDEEGANLLSDKFGFCVNSLNYEILS
jgi:hypothetical protein